MKALQNVPVSVKALPLYLLLGGLVALPFWQQYRHRQVVAEAASSAQVQLNTPQPTASHQRVILSDLPKRIIIPKVSIDLAIVKGTYNAKLKEWSVSPSLVNYATNTAPVNNNSGITILYGHALDWVLGKTKQLDEGDTIYVYGKTGAIFKYRMVGSEIVVPTDTAIFKQRSHKPELLLMTCDGTWSQVRRIMKFELTGAHK